MIQQQISIHECKSQRNKSTKIIQAEKDNILTTSAIIIKKI